MTCPVTPLTASRDGLAIMLDIVFPAAGIAFFGIAAGYAVLCERF